MRTVGEGGNTLHQREKGRDDQGVMGDKAVTIIKSITEKRPHEPIGFCLRFSLRFCLYLFLCLRAKVFTNLCGFRLPTPVGNFQHAIVSPNATSSNDIIE